MKGPQSPHPYGIGVSPGSVVGPVARVGTPPPLPEPERAESDVDGALRRGTEALTAVGGFLEDRAARVGGPASEVLFAQSMMVVDPALTTGIRAALTEGRGLAQAIDRAFAGYRDAMTAAGGYLAERATDLDDLRDRAVAEVLGLPMPGVPDPGHPFVLVATDLAPADTATLDREQVLAIVTERGGPTSHTAIVARSLGIPAVVACPAARTIGDGERVFVDGESGEVTTDPDESVVRAATERARLAAAEPATVGPGRTADGTPVELLVNVGGPADLAAAAATDSEGVGLLRTEFLYLERKTAPDRAELRQRYGEVFAAFADRKVVVRTLDAGADKPMAFLDHEDEPNPALGERGHRLSGRYPELLDDQLAAIAEARSDHDADVWVMAPMISVPAEAAEFAIRVRTHGLPIAGVMIEVPAAAIRAESVLADVDFASIGTNDLGQYVMAADRMSGALAELLDPWQPALLELIAIAAGKGRSAGKPVGVCGEAAADPALAPVLVGLGVTSLSMAPSAVPAVRAAVARHSVEQCQAMAAVALRATDGRSARAAVRESGGRPG